MLESVVFGLLADGFVWVISVEFLIGLFGLALDAVTIDRYLDPGY